ncbi:MULTISPECIES: crotonobetainyl-CoA--carnitine CoA-transferase [unclassified Nocardia]|uniref:crotonobetainyl-CoA--carnitine CoA-transferase n=1 Tax=unclassified Nocardia TaxID=2637762 RepID=UPI001CE4A4A3|nr:MULTISPECIES: crotonobetainyl-CoA--carnitine CoA-transferase [unclassified Nocardia]
MGVDLGNRAQAYLDRYLPGSGPGIAALATYRLSWDEQFCHRVATYFEHAPRMAWEARLAERYARFKRENLRQYRMIVDSGIAVRPWLGEGQPYGGSAQLRQSVRADSVLYVYLTTTAHGPGPAAGDHPMLEPSGVVVDGVEFRHNDLFRAVHDIFGHVLSRSGFGPRGEFMAAFCHMGMYSAAVHPVVFTEHVAQICWYFYGPRAHERRYPPQKVFEYPPDYLDRFRTLFTPPSRQPDRSTS